MSLFVMSAAAIPALSQPVPGPRVLFVIPGDGQSNSMIFVRRQAQGLAAEGVEARLFYLSSRTSPLRMFAEYRRFRSEVDTLQPALIHAHFGTVTAFFAALACGRLPLVITYRGSDLNPAPKSYAWQAKIRAACGRVLSQLAALRAQKIICVSRELRDRLWWRRETAAVLPSGVDSEQFYPGPRALARRKLRWDYREPVVLFNAGRDAQIKRLDLAKAAVEKARRRVPALRLEILDGNVPPDQLPEMMRAADCLLLTSVFEGSPTILQEALASDLPIVTVAVGDAVERLKGVRESTVAPADASALAHALVNLLEPPRRSNGSSKVPDFCSRRIARQLRELYRNLAGA